MRLVDHGAFPRQLRPAVAAPGEGGVDDPAFRHEARAVAAVEREVAVGVADLVAEDLGGEAHLADMRLRVRIEQQLVGVEPVTGLRRVGTVHPVAVDGAGARVWQVAVPDLVGVLGQLDAVELRAARGVEQAQLDLGRVGREQGEVDPEPVPGRTKRRRQTLREPKGPVAAYHRSVSSVARRAAGPDRGELTGAGPHRLLN